MIPAALQRRRGSRAWLISIVVLGVVLGALATPPLLRGRPDGRIGPLDPPRMVIILDELLASS